MAGDWIKMRHNLEADPDVLRIAETVGVDRFSVVGRLHTIWTWADQHSVDGCAIRATTSFLDEMVGCAGFCDGLRTVGWLSGRDWDLQFPNFDRHNGESAKKRAQAQRSMKKSRSASATNVAQNAQPEKRREEKSINPLKSPKGDVDASDDSPKQKPYPEEFEAWWVIYPRRVAKENTLKAFNKALPKITTRHGISRSEALERLMRVTRSFAASPKARGEFCPHPSTWLNQGCYEDDPSDWQRDRTTAPAPAVQRALTLDEQAAAARARREQQNQGGR